jgi:hypothetical protein
LNKEFKNSCTGLNCPIRKECILFNIPPKDAAWRIAPMYKKREGNLGSCKNFTESIAENMNINNN